LTKKYNAYGKTALTKAFNGLRGGHLEVDKSNLRGKNIRFQKNRDRLHLYSPIFEYVNRLNTYCKIEDSYKIKEVVFLKGMWNLCRLGNTCCINFTHN
jgi:hypothetical protein